MLAAHGAPDHSSTDHQEDQSDQGPEDLAGHELALQDPNSLEEPDAADHAQQYADDEPGAHQVCDGLGSLLSISNAMSST